MIVTHSDARRALYCNTGLREYFAEQGWNWADFIVNGIDSEILIATGNPQVLKVVQEAEDRINGRRR